jgi:hypothetical protein
MGTRVLLPPTVPVPTSGILRSAGADAPHAPGARTGLGSKAVTKRKGADWLIRELYAMRQAGKISDQVAGWILECVYGERVLQQLAEQLGRKSA